MASLVQSEKYDVINTSDTSTNGFYVIMFISEVYMLQNNIKIEGGIITAVKLVVRAQYICSVQEITDWFGINIPNSNLSQFWHPQYLIHDLMLLK